MDNKHLLSQSKTANNQLHGHSSNLKEKQSYEREQILIVDYNNQFSILSQIQMVKNSTFLHAKDFGNLLDAFFIIFQRYKLTVGKQVNHILIFTKVFLIFVLIGIILTLYLLIQAFVDNKTDLKNSIIELILTWISILLFYAATYFKVKSKRNKMRRIMNEQFSFNWRIADDGVPLVQMTQDISKIIEQRRENGVKCCIVNKLRKNGYFDYCQYQIMAQGKDLEIIIVQPRVRVPHLLKCWKIF